MTNREKMQRYLNALVTALKTDYRLWLIADDRAYKVHGISAEKAVAHGHEHISVQDAQYSDASKLFFWIGEYKHFTLSFFDLMECSEIQGPELTVNMWFMTGPAQKVKLVLEKIIYEEVDVNTLIESSKEKEQE